jgi:hypothetical protein
MSPEKRRRAPHTTNNVQLQKCPEARAIIFYRVHHQKCGSLIGLNGVIKSSLFIMQRNSVTLLENRVTLCAIQGNGSVLERSHLLSPFLEEHFIIFQIMTVVPISF